MFVQVTGTDLGPIQEWAEASAGLLLITYNLFTSLTWLPVIQVHIQRGRAFPHGLTGPSKVFRQLSMLSSWFFHCVLLLSPMSAGLSQVLVTPTA